MPHALLHVLRYFLLGVLWLFFIYAIRMVYVEIRRSKVERGPAPTAPTPGTDRPVSLKLKVVDPPQRRGRVFDLGEEVTLGRSPGCAVPLEDDTFTSSVHARVFHRGGEFWLEDLGSTNGTYLNDERLNDGPVRLQRGDRMKVGSTTLEVSR
jgi:pSer/pThr/pTyr-binding forkhead associated (FHA) protein